MHVDGLEAVSLAAWEMARADAGAAVDPAALDGLRPEWIAATAPATAASALRAAGRLDPIAPGVRLDAHDWWFRCRFPRPEARAGARTFLCFDGIATLAEVWLGGARLFESQDMFVGRAVDVTDLLHADNELVIACRSLDRALGARRPRPRWRAPMVENQQLRWFRTTLLGRTPGWSPPVPPVGPWRPVRLEQRTGVSIEELSCRPRIDGDAGTVELRATLRPLAKRCERARVTVEGAGGPWQADARVSDGADGAQVVAATVRLDRVQRWWPHTHGAQPLYDVQLACDAGGAVTRVDAGHVGFRTLRLDSEGGDFRLSINDVPIFWRGACWTPLDVVSLAAGPEALRAALADVKAAGMNMLRVPGPTVYESDPFYDLCDELGIVLWHDLMFANMDYPEDPAFAALATAEVAQALGRWQGRPSLGLVCGDSEGEQQAAMWGAPRASWRRPLFAERLAALAHEALPDVPYWPSSASGGAFPHQIDAGSTSYYGVGAYLRPLEDARRAGVRFASECLGFANVPDEATLIAIGSPPVHGPAWKARAPRDLGAGWDFDDVRDHYLRLLFGVDPGELRRADHDRYLALGRVTTGEVMARTFAEWRRPGSSCGGALVWFLRDLVPGAGWGLVDATGRRKAALHLLARALQPVAVLLTDEGLNGMHAHVVNDGPEPLAAELRVRLLRDGETTIEDVRAPVSVPPHGQTSVPVAALLEGFHDVTYAYRFGPPGIDAVVAGLYRDGHLVSDAIHFPLGLSPARERDVGLVAEARRIAPGRHELRLRARRLARWVTVDAGQHRPSDAYFHLVPGDERVVHLEGPASDTPLRAEVNGINLAGPVRVTVVTE